MAPRGPYSVELKQTCSLDNLFEVPSKKIEELDLPAIREFIVNRNVYFLEASATILYKSKNQLSKEECISYIHSLKNYIPPSIIHEAYNSIRNFKISKNNSIISLDEIDNMKNGVNAKIKKLSNLFEKYEPYTNQIIVLGTMDYMRIALREANTDLKDTFDLMMFIKRYLSLIEELYESITSEEEFIYMDLGYLEEIFDQFQEFVSNEHHIIKRIDDDDFDENLFY